MPKHLNDNNDMNATEFVINRLHSFVELFKNARVRYEYDSLAEVHTIEVFPQSVYDSDDYLAWESSMFDDFANNFPGEVIGFISEDAVVGIKNADYAAEGIEFAPYNSEPSFSLDTHTINILLSGVLNTRTSPSTTEPSRDNFAPTFIDYNDYNNELKLAA